MSRAIFVPGVGYTVDPKQTRRVWWDPTDGFVDDAGAPYSRVIQIGSNTTLTAYDHNGRVLELTAAVTLTVPPGLPEGFNCLVIPFGNSVVAPGAGVRLNDDVSSLGRIRASNPLFAIQQLGSNLNYFSVSGF